LRRSILIFRIAERFFIKSALQRRLCVAATKRAIHSLDDHALFSEEKRCIAPSKKTTFSSEKSDFSLGKWLFLY
jgi:hypothetical protein